MTIDNKSDYNDMFVLSKEKHCFYDSKTKKITTHHNHKRDSFDLMNQDIYDKDSGKLLKRESQTTYNSSFIIKLELMYTMNVEDFLNYQYNNSNNPKYFIKYVKGCYTDIKGEGKKLAIKDWIESIEKPKKYDINELLNRFFGELKNYIYTVRINDNIDFIKEQYNLLCSNGRLMMLCNDTFNEFRRLWRVNTDTIYRNDLKVDILNEIENINTELLDAKLKGVWNDTRLIAKNLNVLEVFRTFENDFYKLVGKQTEQTSTKKKDVTKELWFQLGLLFATGKMNEYFEVTDKGDTILKNEYSSKKIAKELNNDSFDKYILATINDYKTNNTDKNIFYNRRKMESIINYCNSNNIEIDKYFLSRLPTE